jgi:hypothetical protein
MEQRTEPKRVRYKVIPDYVTVVQYASINLLILCAKETESHKQDDNQLITSLTRGK